MSLSVPFGRKAAAAALAAITLVSASFAGSNAAEARNGQRGAAIALGIIGLAAGAVVAGAAAEARGGYGYSDDVDYAPAPVYHAPRYYGQGGGYYRPDYRYQPEVYYVPRRFHGHRGYGWRHHDDHRWGRGHWRNDRRVHDRPYGGTH